MRVLGHLARAGNVLRAGRLAAALWIGAVTSTVAAEGGFAARDAGRRHYVVPFVAAGYAERDDLAGLRRWADERGGSVRDTGGVVVYHAPRRVAGGLLRVQPDPAWFGRFHAALSDAEAEAMLAGRLLLVDRITPQAANVLRGSVPSWCCPRVPPIAPGEHWIEATRDRAEAAGFAQTELEWQAVAEQLRADVQRQWSLGAVPWRAAVGLQPFASVQLELPEGEWAALPVELVACPTHSARTWRRWDEYSLVAAAPPAGVGAPGLRGQARLAAGEPDVVRVEEDGLIALGELVDKLALFRRCELIPEYGDEPLYVSAGEYQVDVFMSIVEAATGLLWVRAVAGDDAEQVLSPYPDDLFSELPAVPELPPFGPWAAANSTLGDAFPAELVARLAAGPIVPWQGLPGHVQQRIAAGAIAVRRVADGYEADGGPIDPDRLPDCVARFRVGLMLSVRILVPPQDEQTGLWVAHAMGGNSGLWPVGR